MQSRKSETGGVKKTWWQVRIRWSVQFLDPNLVTVHEMEGVDVKM